MHAFFQLEDASTHISDFFFATQERETESGRVIRSRDYEYLRVIQASCPWMLRYVVAASVIKNYRRNLNHLVYVIKEEQTKYSDPILRTLLALYDEHDLETAQNELSKCASVLKSDYFLASNKKFSERFEMDARQRIFRTYCLTHREIDMKELASKLQMELSQCEKWTVDLIQSEGSKKLNDAKIDTENGVAVMDVRYPSIYERIINKTRDLSLRSYDMAGTMSQM
jgi:translation initiation factor 3 subunit E